MVMNISCKFEKASCNTFFVRAVTVKSLSTLRRRRNEVKSIVSGGYNYASRMEALISDHVGWIKINRNKDASVTRCKMYPQETDDKYCCFVNFYNVHKSLRWLPKFRKFYIFQK